MDENHVLNDISHRRYNPLRDTWVLISPHRTKRPWQGQQEAPSKTTLPEYELKCYLCPGNKRAQGQANPNYKSTFIFVNDFSAVREEQPEYHSHENDTLSRQLLQVEPVAGICYVIAFSPSHNITLADMNVDQIETVVATWAKLYGSHLSPTSPLTEVWESNPLFKEEALETAPKAQYKYMQIFENKGAAMGCSNPHPHGQVWTVEGMPEEPGRELVQMTRYQNKNKASLLEDYARLESQKKERVVFENKDFLVVCPWWATWPFEVMIISKAHKHSIVEFNKDERFSLAEAISEVTTRYDNLFETHFPYSMGIHQAPLEGIEEEITASHFHMHFYPPLLRSATVRKFLVGYEMLAEPQRDITPEQAAERLRNCGGVLYRKSLQ